MAPRSRIWQARYDSPNPQFGGVTVTVLPRKKPPRHSQLTPRLCLVPLPNRQNEISQATYPQLPKETQGLSPHPPHPHPLPWPQRQTPDGAEDKPISHPTQPQLWHTHFRVKGEIPKFGILKGSVEENESQIQAIHREIQEELFPYDEYIPLDPDKINLLPEPIKLNQDSLYTFHYQVSEKEKQIIETNIKRLEKENYGEIVHYQFRTMNEIFTSPQSTQPNYHLLKQYFNGKSRLYINDFYHYLSMQ
jgi:hypothetical protein